MSDLYSFVTKPKLSILPLSSTTVAQSNSLPNFGISSALTSVFHGSLRLDLVSLAVRLWQ